MGLFRKMTSVSTLGMVDYRSDKERTARYAKQSRNELRKQTKVMTGEAKPRPAPARSAREEQVRLIVAGIVAVAVVIVAIVH